jgi:signal peptidase I
MEPEEKPVTTAKSEPKSVVIERQPDLWRFLAELIRTALIVGILAYVIRIFVLQPFVVEGSSMFPRFETNDFLIVDKISYHIHGPERGDIIVFKYPGDLSTNYVKRVIGLPGDTVRITDGKVTVINTTHPNGVTLSEPYVAAGNITTVPTGSPSSEYTVPAGDYFVLGDNRRASSDSREWGFLPKEDLIGRVVVQAFPINQASFVSHARYDGL